MKILVWALGQGLRDWQIIEIDRSLFDVHRLTYNLDYLWAWSDVIESDGPCVALKFNGRMK